jgi:hypothetical protein
MFLSLKNLLYPEENASTELKKYLTKKFISRVTTYSIAFVWYYMVLCCVSVDVYLKQRNKVCVSTLYMIKIENRRVYIYYYISLY